MHDHYVGIDPGLEGAIAWTSPRGFEVFTDTPTISAPGKSKRHYSEDAMARALEAIVDPLRGPQARILLIVEKVHSMPQQSSVSTFTFGTGYGIWLGIIAALRIPSVRVDPRTWKKVCLKDVPKDDVAAQAAVAGRLYPGAASQLVTPRGRVLDGRADALFLAHYGRVSGL